MNALPISGTDKVGFRRSDGGKRAHYMARWVNSRGEKGPWSETLTVTISA